MTERPDSGGSVTRGTGIAAWRQIADEIAAHESGPRGQTHPEGL